MNRFALVFVIFFSQCFSPVSKTGYLDQKALIAREDKIIILPASVISEHGLGSNELSIMYESLLFTLLKEKNYTVFSSEDWAEFCRKKKVGNFNLIQLGIKDIIGENAEQLKELGARYYLRAFLVEHPRDSFSQKRTLFFSIKIYEAKGIEIGVFNGLYESEDSISSKEAALLFNQRLNDWLSLNESRLANFKNQQP